MLRSDDAMKLCEMKSGMNGIGGGIGEGGGDVLGKAGGNDGGVVNDITIFSESSIANLLHLSAVERKYTDVHAASSNALTRRMSADCDSANGGEGGERGE